MISVIVFPATLYAASRCCANASRFGISTWCILEKGVIIVMRLSNKVAIITGSASGMGQAAAELFAQEGASVVVTDISAEMGEATVRSIRDAGGKAIFGQADVADEDEGKHMVNAGIGGFGHGGGV